MRRRVIVSMFLITVIIGESFLLLGNDKQTVDPSIQGIELLAFIVDREGLSLSDDTALLADQIKRVPQSHSPPQNALRHFPIKLKRSRTRLLKGFL